MSAGLIRGVRATVIFAALVLAAASAAPGDGAGKSPQRRGQLDGMRFVGWFAPADAPVERKQDTVSFGDGHFWSANCVPCGFAPGVYWVRQEGDAIHFRGEMESPERGTFTYSGVVRDGRLSASINWHQERWYWSIDRDFRFVGTLSGTAVTERAVHVARVAAAQGELPKPPEICPL